MTRLLTPESTAVSHFRTGCWLLIAAGLLLASSGCSLMRGRGAAESNVVSARQLTIRGEESIRQDKWDEAEQLFTEAIQVYNADERAHSMYAEVLWRRGDRLGAIEHLEKAVTLSGGAAPMQVRLGDMYLAAGDLAGARYWGEKAIAVDQKLPGAWALLGKVHQRMGEDDAALANFHRALSYQPHLPDVQLAVASIYRQSDRPQRMLATLQRLQENYPPGEQPTEVLAQLGAAYKRLGRYENAVQTLMIVAKRQPDSAEALYQLSEAQLLSGDPLNAQVALQQALSINPRHRASLALQPRIDSSRYNLARQPQR